MPTNHLFRLCVIAIVMFAGIWAIFPSIVLEPLRILDPRVPLAEKHNLRPGIDMAGGTSLLYEIKPPEGGYTEGLSTQVMDALKKRVDPDGVKNLVWRPQGNTRLEIQMPLTGQSGKASASREKFADAQSALLATNVRAGTALDAVQRLSGDARESRLNRLAGDSPARKEIFAGLVTAWDAREAARKRNDASAQARAEIEFETLKARIEGTNVNVPLLEQTLNAIEQATLRLERKAKDARPVDPEAIALVERLKVGAGGFPSQAAAFEGFVAAHREYFRLKDQLDDAAGLKRLLQGSGVLRFHILVAPDDTRVPEFVARLEQGQGSVGRSGDTARWAVVDKPENFKAEHYAQSGVVADFGGQRWVLLDTRPEKSLTSLTGDRWALKSASPQRDPQSGEVHVAFQMDPTGGRYMGRLTGSNIGKPMAIVLDDKVISAPNVQSQINDSGQITGRYTAKEISYLVSTLNAGSLPAQLADEPLSERTVGPQLGEENLRAGFMSCFVGLGVVAVFLICYYYLSGVVAYVAVILNLLLTVGLLAMLNATFTLPGVAALVLSLGTAVDANVLIFERLREEQQRGFPIKIALRNAYDRAFSAIFDSNVVTACTSLVLYILGSEEVKGFGLTLLLGIATSMFTSLYVTKTIFGILVDKFGVRRLGSVPLTFPWWDRFLKPSIDWMKWVWAFGLASALALVMGLGLFGWYIKQGEMFDIEFSAGTAVTIELRQPLSNGQVRDLIDKAKTRTVTVSASGGGPERKLLVDNALPSPSVVSVGTDNLVYELVTPNIEVAAVRAAVLETFGEVLKINIPSTFTGVNQPLAQVLNRTVLQVDAAPPAGRYVPENWGEYRGGVVVYLDALQPPKSPREIEGLIKTQRLQPGSLTRSLPPVVVISPTGPNEPTSEAIVLAVDPGISADEDLEKWQQAVAGPVWKLVNEAVASPPSLAKVSNFDASVAGETTNAALIALIVALVVIMAYVWVRFGTLTYGFATTVALLHDTLFILAVLGVSHLLANTAVGNFLLLESFRVNLTIVAGILTIMGYSMVDTIVVFDRIRELRGQRGGVLTRTVINDAINQTLSRTLLTAGTTMATLFVMYVFGGAGIHGFTFVLLVGIVVGTYSSIAIAAPLLMVGMKKSDRASGDSARPGERKLAKV
jgi:SecD/SecF fusion protein